MTKQLNLFSTSHCHLCDLAGALFTELALDIQLKIVEISADDSLLALYGTRIPVLQRADNKAELNWPFTKAEIEIFLK